MWLLGKETLRLLGRKIGDFSLTKKEAPGTTPGASFLECVAAAETICLLYRSPKLLAATLGLIGVAPVANYQLRITHRVEKAL